MSCSCCTDSTCCTGRIAPMSFKIKIVSATYGTATLSYVSSCITSFTKGVWHGSFSGGASAYVAVNFYSGVVECGVNVGICCSGTSADCLSGGCNFGSANCDWQISAGLSTPNFPLNCPFPWSVSIGSGDWGNSVGCGGTPSCSNPGTTTVSPV